MHIATTDPCTPAKSQALTLAACTTHWQTPEDISKASGLDLIRTHDAIYKLAICGSLETELHGRQPTEGVPAIRARLSKVPAAGETAQPD